MFSPGYEGLFTCQEEEYITQFLTREVHNIGKCHGGWQHLSCSGCSPAREEHQLLEAYQPVSSETSLRSWNNSCEVLRNL